jgi:hypothetical protein
MLDIEAAEKAILAKLDDHRMRGRTGRKNEWLEGIEPNKVLEIAVSTLDGLDAEYELLLEGTLCCIAYKLALTCALHLEPHQSVKNIEWLQ